MGKPVIGDAQMLAIYETMQRLRSLEAPIPSRAGAALQRPREPIALLAATLLQLRPADLLVTEREEPFAAEVLALAQEATFAPEHRTGMQAVQGGAAPAVAAGHAMAQARVCRPGDDGPITAALLRPARQIGPALGEAMRLAGQSVLPLIFIVQDGFASTAPVIASIENVEVVRIDADDALACCRVMQESLLRVRNRWGSVVLHAVKLPGTADPVVGFEAHLRRCGISIPGSGE